MVVMWITMSIGRWRDWEGLTIIWNDEWDVEGVKGLFEYVIRKKKNFIGLFKDVNGMVLMEFK